MVWKDGRLLCDKSLKAERGHACCGAVIETHRYGKALRLAHEAGWWRGNRGGRMVDLCADHNPRRGSAT